MYIYMCIPLKPRRSRVPDYAAFSKGELSAHTLKKNDGTK